MKRINFFLFLFIFIVCLNNPTKAQEQIKTLVGKLEKGIPTLTIDKTEMLATYNANLLKYSEIDAKFTDVSIKMSSDKEYFLVFKGAVYTSSFYVASDGKELYALSAISCTTSACAEEDLGCYPKPNGTACYPCKNKGKCTKTTGTKSLID